MEHLKAFAQAAQDRDGVRHARFVDDDHLETAFQRGVLLDALAVFVERGRADHVEFAAREHRLEHVAGVHRALGRARAHDGVQFVDEEQDAPFGGLHLVEHGFEAFLELAPVLRARDQRPHVEGEDGLVPQPLGNVAVHDPLGQAFHDRGLADAGIADEHGVVLRLAAEDLDHPADLGVPADDRVQDPSASLVHQITAVLLQRFIRALRCRRGDPLTSPDACQGAEERLPGDAVLGQPSTGVGRRSLLDQRKGQVLHRHVLVLEPLGRTLGRVQQPGQALRDIHLPRRGARPGDLRASGQRLLCAAAQRAQIGTGLFEHPRHDALGLVEQRHEQMLTVDLGVPQLGRRALRILQRFLGLLGQAVHVHGGLPPVPLRPAACKAVSSRLIRSSRSSTTPIAA